MGNEGQSLSRNCQSNKLRPESRFMLWRFSSVLLLTSVMAAFTQISFSMPMQEKLQSSQGTSRTRLSTPDLANKASQSVVTINTESGLGSGVILDSSGVVVTSLHVIRGDTQVAVKLSNGDIYDDVGIIDLDERKDLVLLKIKAFGLTPASLANSDQVRVGDRVVLIGSPKGLDLSVTDGLVSAIRDSGEGFRLIQTNAAASPGSSGGGMFNEYGELIGILCARLQGGENLNFAIPVNYVRGLLSTQLKMTLAELKSKYPLNPERNQATGVTARDAAESSTAKMRKLLEGSGLNFETAAEGGWTVSYKGDNLKLVRVYISIYEDFAVIQSRIAETAEPTLAQMKEMLKRSFTENLVKVGMGDDDSIVTLHETEIRLLDPAALKKIVQSVASLADEVAGILKDTIEHENRPNLIAPPRNERQTSLSLLQGHATIRYDSTQWRQQKTDEVGVYQFNHSGGDLYLRVITERIEVPSESLLEVALGNAKGVDPNAKIMKQGLRTINGVKVQFLEYDLTVSNVPVTYYGHFYSDSYGTIQIIGFTSRNLMNEARKRIETFCSGFEVSRR